MAKSPQLTWIGPILPEAIVNEASALAQRLRAELSLHVGAPGGKAICAVLLLRKKTELTQHDAQRLFGTAPQSMRRYGALRG